LGLIIDKNNIYGKIQLFNILLLPTLNGAFSFSNHHI